MLLFYFLKQNTAYEMRISDWSSDVCSSDLPRRSIPTPEAPPTRFACSRPCPLLSAYARTAHDRQAPQSPEDESARREPAAHVERRQHALGRDRTSVV